tara:strand:- start:129 stop:689 length:561 start_codon:yes stop_codon:yes gene_type:complete
MIDVQNIFSDVKYIPLNIYNDKRGFFSEIYNQNVFKKHGISNSFIQDNISYSLKKNTLRGLHFQLKPFSQAKMIKVLKGSIYDVFIDLRKDSDEFEKHGFFELNQEQGWLLIPNGFAHGFLTTSDQTTVIYKVDNYYNKEKESGIIWNDSSFKIKWPCNKNNLIISEKDNSLLTWNSIKESFIEEI